VTSAAFGQVTVVVEPVTGNFEYIGQGNAGDSGIVYLTFNALAIGGVVETAGFDITYADAAGNPIGGTVNIADLVADDVAGLSQQVPGGGDDDNNIESGETWSLNIISALGGSIPLGASLINITFDPAGTPASTVANADGTSAGGNDAIDGRLQIVTTRSTPTAAFFDGTGATSQMFVTYTTPTVGFVAPNTASIPLFGSQDISALGTTVSANSAQVGGGAGTDFEFTDANNFNSATGLAGAADISAGSFALPAGTTNVLQWQFDDTASGLKSGRAFRVDTATTTVRDSAGNQVNNTTIVASQLLPLAVSSVVALDDTASGSTGVLEVTYNRPLNPAAVGDVAFYRDANGGGNSIRRVVAGTPTNVNDLDATAVAFDPATPTKVRVTINDASSSSNDIGADGLSADGQGDSFQHTFDAGVGVVPQASFGATPAFQVAQNGTVTIADGVAPQIVGTHTADTNGDGILDGYILELNEPVAVSGTLGSELSLNGGINTFPINLVNNVTGALPTAIPTVVSTTLSDNIIPIAAGDFSVPDTGSGVSQFSFDSNFDGIIQPNETNNAILFTYDAAAKDLNNNGQTSDGGDLNEPLFDTAAVGAVNLFINPTAAAVVNPLTNTNVPAGAGVIADANGNAFLNDGGVVDVTAPFDAPIPAVFSGAEGNDFAAPAVVRLCHQPGDNSPDNGNVEPLSDTQLLFEQDLTVGDQNVNDLVRIITGENLAGGISTTSVTENLLSYGGQGDTFGGDDNNNGNDDFLNNNSDGFNPANANVAVFRPLNATDPNAVVPGITLSLTEDTFGRGIRDGNSNQTSFNGLTLDNCAAPYIAHIVDSNNVVQAGVFLTPDASGDFVAGISGRATQPIDAATLRIQDFVINFGGTITGVAVDAEDPNVINWTTGGAPIGINNTITLTYNGANPGAFLVASQAPPAGTGIAVSPANSGALDGTGANAVRELQDPFQGSTDVATLPVVANLVGFDGNPLPINTKVFVFNAIPIVREITADHNNVPFTYRTDDPIYNNDIGTQFSSVYPSLNAFTSWLHGVRTEVYLHRNRRNDQQFTNTKVNPFLNATTVPNGGDTGGDNSALVDSIRLNINAGRLTAITFSGTGEQSQDRVRTGRLDLAWDVIRSFNGTLDNYRRFGYAWGSRPVPAGVGVVDNDTGRVNMMVSRPVTQFGGSNRFDSIAKPLIFVIELPNGERYAVSSVLAASNTNDHDGDGTVGDPILFEAAVLRSNNSDGTARDGLVVNFDLRRVGSQVVNPEWNLIPLDRAFGVVAGTNSNLPALPAGVTTSNIVSYNTAQFPYANPLSSGVFWAENGGGFFGIGTPLPGAYDGKWTAADDVAGPFSTIGLDPDLITHFAFTLTTRGVQLGNGITSLVGGYGVAFYNNADLSGGSSLNNFGLFQFGTALAQTSVFGSNPISSSNNRAGNGWILGAVTNPFDPATGFFAANAGSDYFIAFRNNGRNPATGNSTVLIEVGSLDAGASTNNPNDLREVGVGGSEAGFIHYDN
jgi:hypothetical protein